MERSKSRNLASNADSMIQNGYLFYYVGMIKAARWFWNLAGAGRITTVLSRPLLDSERSRSSPCLRIRFGSPRIRGSPSDAWNVNCLNVYYVNAGVAAPIDPQRSQAWSPLASDQPSGQNIVGFRRVSSSTLFVHRLHAQFVLFGGAQAARPSLVNWFGLWRYLGRGRRRRSAVGNSVQFLFLALCIFRPIFVFGSLHFSSNFFF